MKELFFTLAFIWVLSAVGSLFIGPFVGVDRQRLRRDLVEYWNVKSLSPLMQLARRGVLVFVWAGFLLPVVYPLPGLVAAVFFAQLT